MREKGLCMALPSVTELEDLLRNQSGRFFAKVTGDVWVPILIGQPDGDHELPWMLECKWTTQEANLVLRMMGQDIPCWVINNTHYGKESHLATLTVNPREHRQVTVEISCGYNYYARTFGHSGSNWTLRIQGDHRSHPTLRRASLVGVRSMREVPLPNGTQRQYESECLPQNIIPYAKY